MKKIDIVIPVYKAQKTLARALHSIAAQTVKDSITVYLTLDGETKSDYPDIFKNYWGFKIVTTVNEVNRGPGYSRDVALWKGKAPYVMFVDADDTLANAYVCEWLLARITDKKYKGLVAVTGQILEEITYDNFGIKDDDFTWLTGKIFSRKFIRKNDIHFTETYLGEDVGFLRKIQLQLTSHKQILIVDQPVYFWHKQAESLVRVKEDKIMEQKYYKVPKYVYINFKDVCKYFYDRDAINEKVYEYIINTFINFYVLYDASLTNAPEYSEHILDLASKIYRMFIFIPSERLQSMEDVQFNRLYPAIYSNEMMQAKSKISYPAFKEMLGDLDKILAENIKLKV